MKKEQDVCILAHAYQGQEILEVADYMGDSYGLSVQASKSNCKGVIMCGVRFMAETCKVLSPEKKVWLANPTAGCPMAEQLDLESLRKLKAEHPGYAVVAYINTTSELKTECDVCVTSSSAVQICSKLDNDKILFIPDPNLGRFVAEKLPEKEFAFYKGGCPRHIIVSAQDVEKAKKAHPDALLLVHPECRQEVVELADYVGSTTGIMEYAKKSPNKEFIIGTEQYCGTSPVCMSGQTVLSAVCHADLYEHEDHNTDGYLQLPEGNRRRSDRTSGKCYGRRRTLHSPYGRTRRVNIINREKVELLRNYIFSSLFFIKIRSD